MPSFRVGQDHVFANSINAFPNFSNFQNDVAARRAYLGTTAIVALTFVISVGAMGWSQPVMAQQSGGAGGGNFEGSGGAGALGGRGGTGGGDFNVGGNSSQTGVGGAGTGSNSSQGGGGGGAGATFGVGGAGGGGAAGGASAGATGGTVGGDNGGGGGGGGQHGFVGTGLPITTASGSAGGAGGTATGGAFGDGGGGGAGGFGAVVTGAMTGPTALGVAITGGAGGQGGASFQSGFGSGGGGGGGGLGLLVQSTIDALTINQAVTGGAGGAGGNTVAIGDGGGGGGGGAGVVFSGTATNIVVNSTVTGGAGGASGVGGNAKGGGGGGTGLTFLSGGSVTINGTVRGGNAGAGGTPAGGVGINGANLTVINAGTIAGGGTANAVAFTGGTNAFEYRSGSITTGNVVAFSTADTFRLGGDTSGTFNLANIAAGGLYRGFGILEKSGAGTWTVSGVTGSTMEWRVNEGTLDLGGATQTTGALTQTGGTIQNGTVNASAFGVQAGTLSATLDGTGTLTKTTIGTTTLSGVNTYTGATNVNGGTLNVNGSIATSSLTTVNTGGTLSGTGTVGNTTISSGTLAPGNGIGTLNVNGNLVFSSTFSYMSPSSYMVELSPTTSDSVNVTGTATLGGATVNASFATGSYISKQYTIVNATGGVIGTFGALANTNLPANFNSSLTYDATHAYLNLALNFTTTPTPPTPTPPTPTPTPTTPPPTPIAPPPTPTPPAPTAPTAPLFSGLNVNQANVAGALVNFFNVNGGIPMTFGTLTSTGLTIVSGPLATGTQQTTFDATNQFFSVMTDPFAAGRGDGAGQGGVSSYADDALNYAATRNPNDALAGIYRKAPPAAPAFVARWNVWAAGFGGSQTTEGNAALGSNTASSRVYGTAVGADYLVSPNTVAGVAMAGGGTNFGVAGLGSGRSDLFQAGAFVRHTQASAYVSAAFAYGWQDVTTDRSVGADRLNARFTANTYSGRLEGGNRFLMPWVGGIGLTPYGAVQVTALELPSYAETSAAGATTFALAYAGKTATATRTELGLRSDKSFAVNDAILTLRGRAAWAHDYNTDRSATATFQSLPGASFVVNGASPASDAALTTASAEMSFASGISLAATFEGEFSAVTQSYAGKGVVRYAW